MDKMLQAIVDAFGTCEIEENGIWRPLDMGTYKDDFKKRNNRFVAEPKCVEFLQEKNITHTRYGFDALFDIQPKDFLKLPPHIARTPDYVMFLDKAVFMEAKGCHDILRLKDDDMKAYDWWVEIMPMTMFIYSTMEKTHKLISYPSLKELAMKGKTGRYPDNNKLYYEVPWESI